MNSFVVECAFCFNSWGVGRCSSNRNDNGNESFKGVINLSTAGSVQGRDGSLQGRENTTLIYPLILSLRIHADYVQNCFACTRNIAGFNIHGDSKIRRKYVYYFLPLFTVSCMKLVIYYSIITFSYTKYFVHSYTADVVFILSYYVLRYIFHHHHRS